MGLPSFAAHLLFDLDSALKGETQRLLELEETRISEGKPPWAHEETGGPSVFLNEKVALPVLHNPACDPDGALQAAIGYNVPLAGVAAPAESPGVHDTTQKKQWTRCSRRITCTKPNPLHLFWDSTLYPQPLTCNGVAMVTSSSAP